METKLKCGKETYMPNVFHDWALTLLGFLFLLSSFLTCRAKREILFISTCISRCALILRHLHSWQVQRTLKQNERHIKRSSIWVTEIPETENRTKNIWWNNKWIIPKFDGSYKLTDSRCSENSRQDEFKIKIPRKKEKKVAE